MKKLKIEIILKKRYLGILFLVIVQLIVGFTHLFFGLALISDIFSFISNSSFHTIYAVYTLIYGSLTTFFTYLIWKGKRLGCIASLLMRVTGSRCSVVMIVVVVVVFVMVPVAGSVRIVNLP